MKDGGQCTSGVDQMDTQHFLLVPRRRRRRRPPRRLRRRRDPRLPERRRRLLDLDPAAADLRRLLDLERVDPVA